MLPTQLFLTSGIGTHKEDKNARDRASVQAGISRLNLVSVSSILPAGIKLIDRATFDSRVKDGQIVFAINGICQSNKPGQRVTASLSLAVPHDPTVTGFVTELFEYPGLQEDQARQRTEKMVLQLFAEQHGDTKFVADDVWQPTNSEYEIANHPLRLLTVSQSGVCNEDGDFTCAIVAAVFLK
jgi:arginine decarboxylase